MLRMVLVLGGTAAGIQAYRTWRARRLPVAAAPWRLVSRVALALATMGIALVFEGAAYPPGAGAFAIMAGVILANGHQRFLEIGWGRHGPHVAGTAHMYPLWYGSLSLYGLAGALDATMPRSFFGILVLVLGGSIAGLEVGVAWRVWAGVRGRSNA